MRRNREKKQLNKLAQSIPVTPSQAGRSTLPPETSPTTRSQETSLPHRASVKAVQPADTQVSIDEILQLICPISVLAICSQYDGAPITADQALSRTQSHIAGGSYGRISVGHVLKEMLNPYLTSLSGRQSQYPGDKELVAFKTPRPPTDILGEADIPFKDILPELALLASPALLYHENVVDLLGFFWEPYESGLDHQFAPTLILEFTDQGSLKTLFSTHPEISVTQRIGLCRDVCRALLTFHQECMIKGNHVGIFHGDLKPENILVFKSLGGSGYRAKLCDLGTCLLYDPQSPGPTDKFLGQGTIGWRAPELSGSIPSFSPSSKHTEAIKPSAAESFAFGLIIIFIILGKEPYRIPSVADVLLREYFKREVGVARCTTAADMIEGMEPIDRLKAQQWLITDRIDAIKEAVATTVSRLDASEQEKQMVLDVLRKTLHTTPSERVEDFSEIYQTLGGDETAKCSRTPIIATHDAFAANDMNISVQNAINSVALTARMPHTFHSWLARHLESSFASIPLERDESMRSIASHISLLRGLLSFVPPMVPEKQPTGLEWLSKAIELGNELAVPIYCRLATLDGEISLSTELKAHMKRAASLGCILALEDLPPEDRLNILQSTASARLSELAVIEGSLCFAFNYVSHLLERKDILRVAKKYLSNGWNVDAQTVAGAEILSPGYVGYQAFHGGTALHWAVERNNLTAVQALLELGASPYVRNSRGVTPWRLAVECRLLPLIQCFAEKPSACTDRTARSLDSKAGIFSSALIGYLSTGASFVTRTIETLQYLRHIGDITRLDMYEPSVSGTTGDVRLLRELLTVDYTNETDEHLARRLLLYTVFSSESEAVETLLSLLPQLTISNDTMQILCAAIQASGDPSGKIFRLLLDHLDPNFNINALFTHLQADQTRSLTLSEDEGMSLLSFAFFHGKIIMAIELLKRGANSQQQSLDKSNGTAGLTPLGMLLFPQTHYSYLALKEFLSSDYLQGQTNRDFILDHAEVLPSQNQNIFHMLCSGEDERVHTTITHKTAALEALLLHCEAIPGGSARLGRLLNAQMTIDGEPAMAPMHLAAATGFAAAIRLLGNFGADPMKLIGDPNAGFAMTALHIAEGTRGPNVWEEEAQMKFIKLSLNGFPWFSPSCPVALQMKKTYEDRTLKSIQALEELLRESEDGRSLLERRARC